MSAVSHFEISDHTLQQKGSKRVIVIGAGCAGLAAAWHLKKVGIDVKLFECDSKLGGHANTINVDGIDVDTGFMVYNAFNYPHLMAFFEELGVEGEDTSMGFSVSANNGTFEYAAGESVSKLFATTSNLWNPYFYMMIWEMIRFNNESKLFLNQCSTKTTTATATGGKDANTITVGEFLSKHKFSQFFAKNYLIPMTAAIWSASNQSILTFPAVTLFTFLNNHLLLQVTGNLTWKTPAKRSQEYVKKIETELGSQCIYLNKNIVRVTRIPIISKKANKDDNQPNKANDIEYVVKIVDDKGIEIECDEVIFACHPDQALRVLGNDADHIEKSNLSRFQYSINETYVHSDDSLMPKSKHAWTCWNYISYRDVRINHQSTTNMTGTGSIVTSMNDARPVYVTYWLNKLQNLKHSKNIFVSLNPEIPPASEKTYKKLLYSHPQYTADSVAAQKDVAQTQGYKNTYYCGAWMGYGFHEDGFRSGIEVATAVSGVVAPWIKRRGYDAMIPASKSILITKQQSLFQSLFSSLTRPLSWSLEKICQYSVLTFLKHGFRKGTISFITGQSATSTTPNTLTTTTIQGSEQGCDEPVAVRVKNPWFWVRLAFESDLGMAKSYIAGEWEVVDTGANYDGLTKVMLVLLDNIPNGKVIQASMDFSNLFTSWIGSIINWLSYSLTMDNSIANSQSNIHAHYDLSNELFIKFLDKDHMMYSCGLFETQVISTTGITSTTGISGGSGTSRGMLGSDLSLDKYTSSTSSSISGSVSTSSSFPSSSPSSSIDSHDIAPNFNRSLLSHFSHQKSTSLFHRTQNLTFVSSLESAQTNKIQALLSRLEPLGPQHTLLDIGFGWGGICIYAAEKYGCHVHGITLSIEQKALAEKKVAEKRLKHLVTFELVDYRQFAKQRLQRKNRKFDRIVSCEMIEAVGHNHLKSFFATVDSLLDNEGIFVMQAITMPDARYPLYVKSADFLNSIIFPGGCCPSLSALLTAMATTSTLHLENIVNLNLHYAETLRQWRQRFNQHLPTIIPLGFDDSFIRLWNLYLCQCEAGFEAQIINLQILTFSRPGNPNMIAKRAAEYISLGMKLID